MTATWQDIQFFRSKEFDSPDKLGSGLLMHMEFIEALDRLRRRCDFPFFINSGYRTRSYNERVGGVKCSAHETGWAADIRAESSSAKFTIVREALASGDFCRIGIGATFIHLDMDPAKPQRVLWTYA